MLNALVATLERDGYPEAGRADLASFVRELHVVSVPSAPIVPRLEETCLVARIADALGDTLALAKVVSSTIEQRGRVVVSIDRDLLSTLLGELLSNALKYRGRGAVTVRVDVTRGRARLVVENDGTPTTMPGRPTRFVRAETRRDVRGYGVGLWLVDRIAKAHRGTSTLRASGGKTRAEVRIPLHDPTSDGALVVTLRPSA